MFGLIQGTTSGSNSLPSETSNVSNASLDLLTFQKNSYNDILKRFNKTESFQTQEETFSINDATDIIFWALGWYATYATMTKHTATALLSCTDIPFMEENFGYALMWGEPSSETIDNMHSERLENVLASWNFQQVKIPGDGNCLFASVALHLQTVLPSLNSSHPLQAIIDSLEIAITPTTTLESIILSLRKSVVNEWLGEHSQYYSRFLTLAQLENEAACFLESGEFAGELGDLVIAALSNVLQSPIVVFTSIHHLPVLVITPSHQAMINPSPIYLTYNQEGPGHYVHCDELLERGETQNKSCTCGRKAQSALQF